MKEVEVGWFSGCGIEVGGKSERSWYEKLS